MKSPDQTMGFDEAGSPVGKTEFDYSEVDKGVFDYEPESDLTEFSAEELEAALKALRVLLQWIFQNGMKNADGLKIRAICICWIFLKELRPLTLTQMANGFGMEKQSLGRWVDDFKERFPIPIRTCHMRTE